MLPGYYVPMQVAHDDLEDALRILPRLGFVGVNVTIPHKESVLALADQVSDQASLVGAANTLSFLKDGKIYADNTDGYGFIENLRQAVPDWRADTGPAVILGAGGAARAVLTALLEAGAREIRLSNRTRARSDALQSEFGHRIEVYDWVQAGNAIEGAATIVNTTSLGMEGKPAFRVPLDGLTSDMVVNDLVYTPLETTLIREARDAGAIAVDGLGMLLHQGAPGFERWFGLRPDVDEDCRRAALGP